jgi:hypothetical protein
VGLVVDLVHVGFCTTVDIGFDVGGRRGRCGGTICRCIMINGVRARGVEEQLDVRTDILDVVIKVDRRCIEDRYLSSLK